MNCTNFRCALATLVLALLFSSAAATTGVTDAQRRDIDRLAELAHWKPGSVVADIGAGDGTYSFLAAETVGPSGRVYATEIDREKLQALRSDVAQRNLANVTIVEGTAGDTKLPSNCCDTIFLRRVYHHLTQPQEFDRSLVRSLKPGGYLAIIDFPPDASLPAVEGVPKNRSGHGIDEKMVVEELTTAGFRLEKTIDDWSSHDYCALFNKPAL
jgi:ubiquinone/menaquinone biosynthesis C-methylase UbiE